VASYTRKRTKTFRFLFCDLLYLCCSYSPLIRHHFTPPDELLSRRKHCKWGTYSHILSLVRLPIPPLSHFVRTNYCTRASLLLATEAWSLLRIPVRFWCQFAAESQLASVPEYPACEQPPADAIAPILHTTCHRDGFATHPLLHVAKAIASHHQATSEGCRPAAYVEGGGTSEDKSLKHGCLCRQGN